MTTKQYAERDLMALDAAGGHYGRHVSAMTGEQLHSKSDIAAELGFRDMQIAKLKQQLTSVSVESNARGEIVERLIGQYSCAGYHAVQNSLNPGQSLLFDAMQVMKSTNTDTAFKSVMAEKLALALEADYLRNEIKQHSECTHQCEVCGKDDPCNTDDVCRALNHPIPATDALLNSVRAEGAMLASQAISRAVDCFKEEHRGAVAECADIARDMWIGIAVSGSEAESVGQADE